MNRLDQTQLSAKEGIEPLRAFTWRKSWVRPYESLYSVYRTFTLVNIISDTMAPRVLTNGKTKASVLSNHLYAMLSDTCVPEDENNNLDSYVTVSLFQKKFASETCTDKFPIFLNGNAKSICISPKIKYCPECLKSGYHSWMFQYAALKQCPIHHINLTESNNMPLNEKKNIMKCHPDLQNIDTRNIAETYHKAFKGIKKIQAFKMNSLFDVSNILNKKSDQSLWEVGDEIYVGPEVAAYNVKQKMTESFKTLVRQLRDEYASMKRIADNEYAIENILECTFHDWNLKKSRQLNPMMSSSAVISLQVHLSLMDNAVKCRNDSNEDKKLLYKYIQQVLSISGPLSFYALYHPHATELWLLKKTPAFIDTAGFDEQIILRSILNENHILLRCIDDHVKFQWKNFKALAKKYNSDDKLIGNKLPHVCYLVLTDENDLKHVIRCVEECERGK